MKYRILLHLLIYREGRAHFCGEKAARPWGGWGTSKRQTCPSAHGASSAQARRPSETFLWLLVVGLSVCTVSHCLICPVRKLRFGGVQSPVQGQLRAGESRIPETGPFLPRRPFLTRPFVGRLRRENDLAWSRCLDVACWEVGRRE